MGGNDMKSQLTREEKNLENKFFSEKWLSEDKRKIAEYQKAASYHLKKDARLNIRVSSADIKLIKERAVEEGLPYQSLVSSLIHKYAWNELIDRKQVKIIAKELKTAAR